MQMLLIVYEESEIFTNTWNEHAYIMAHGLYMPEFLPKEPPDKAITMLEDMCDSEDVQCRRIKSPTVAECLISKEIDLVQFYFYDKDRKRVGKGSIRIPK